MKYHAPTNQFTVNPHSLKQAANLLRYAIRHIRAAGGYDPKGCKYPLKMESAEYAESAVLRAAGWLDIDLGATEPGRLDVSEE